MTVDGSSQASSVLGINGSIIPLQSSTAGTVNVNTSNSATGTITIPQLVGNAGANFVSKSEIRIEKFSVKWIFRK